jgi:hypothetical protein
MLKATGGGHCPSLCGLSQEHYRNIRAMPCGIPFINLMPYFYLRLFVKNLDVQLVCAASFL